MSTRYRAGCEECPWTGTYSSAAKADYAFRQHSCSKHLAAAESRARGDARRAAVDRLPKPCQHKKAAHEHGTHAAYILDRCRCSQCTTANTAYERMRSRQCAYGRWNPWADAGPVREHVLALTAAGVGLKRVAKLAGVSHGALSKLVYGTRLPDGTQRAPSKHVRSATAEALLAVTATADVLAGGAYVDATGARRRLRALVAAGWSQSRLAGELGMLPSNFGRLISGDQRCTAAHARAARELYDRLAFTAPPRASHRQKISVSRARNYASARRVATTHLVGPRGLRRADVRRRLPALDRPHEGRRRRGRRTPSKGWRADQAHHRRTPRARARTARRGTDRPRHRPPNRDDRQDRPAHPAGARSVGRDQWAGGRLTCSTTPPTSSARISPLTSPPMSLFDRAAVTSHVASATSPAPVTSWAARTIPAVTPTAATSPGTDMTVSSTAASRTASTATTAAAAARPAWPPAVSGTAASDSPCRRRDVAIDQDDDLLLLLLAERFPSYRDVQRELSQPIPPAPASLRWVAPRPRNPRAARGPDAERSP